MVSVLAYWLSEHMDVEHARPAAWAILIAGAGALYLIADWIF